MASDFEEEMQSELESSVDTRELLPRDGLITYNRYGSLVAISRRERSSHLKLSKMLSKPTKVTGLKWRENILLFDRFAV